MRNSLLTLLLCPLAIGACGGDDDDDDDDDTADSSNVDGSAGDGGSSDAACLAEQPSVMAIEFFCAFGETDTDLCFYDQRPTDDFF